MKQQTINFWTDHFEKQKQSGLTQKDYCIQNNLSVKYFANVKIKINKLKLNNARFVKIPFDIKNKFLPSKEIQLVINDKYKINLHSNFDAETLKRILKTIEG